MKLPKINILDEKNKILRTKSQDVTFPLMQEDKNLIKDIIDYLKMSQIKKYYEKYDLRPGMGLAFIQLGIPKNIFVIVEEVDEEVFETYVIINPKILSHSEELIYVGEGEGCLSVNREIDGIVPRFARMKVAYQDIEGNYQEIRVREDISVAFQHEMDHLNGILFVDKIDKNNPFKNKDKMREI
ncbi:MAG: peptide deformylase [Firmicutes bacterium]|nr:peptide deformylase [Bacillota bacterium]